MFDLTIAASGEVKLGYEVIGQITWSSTTAHLGGAGAWVREDFCWDNLPRPVEDELNSLRDQITEMEDDCQRANARAGFLRATLNEVRSMLGVQR